jgi:hypothetical protein
MGWLFAARDGFAFETKDGFLLVKKEPLITFLKGKLIRERVKYPWQAKYRLYRRKGRRDYVTLVEASEVEKLAFETWGEGR